MKRIISLILCIILLFALSIPASAMTSYKKAPLTDSEFEKIDRAFVKARYDYRVMYKDETMTFDEFYAENSILKDEYANVLYYGKCENGAPILFFYYFATFSCEEYYFGEYSMEVRGFASMYPETAITSKDIYDGTPLEDVEGPVVFDNGKFIRLEKSYEQGILTDSDLETLWKMAPQMVPNYGGRTNNPVTVYYKPDKDTYIKYEPEGVSSVEYLESEPGEGETGGQSTEPVTDSPDQTEDTANPGGDTAEAVSDTGESAAEEAEAADDSTAAPSAKVTRTVVKTMDKGTTTALIVTACVAAVLIAAAVTAVIIIKKKKVKSE